MCRGGAAIYGIEREGKTLLQLTAESYIAEAEKQKRKQNRVLGEEWESL